MPGVPGGVGEEEGGCRGSRGVMEGGRRGRMEGDQGEVEDRGECGWTGNRRRNEEVKVEG